MEQYVITIIDNDVYVNKTKCFSKIKLDENNKSDLQKLAIAALVNQMGMDPVKVFEELSETFKNFKG